MPRVKELGGPSPTQVNKNIKKMLIDKDWSIKHFAKIVGLSERTMYNKLQFPDRWTLTELYRVASKFRISPEDLFRRD